MNLATLTADDVIEAFKSGLRNFLERERGSFGVRRVTLRQEHLYPSDQDYCIRFTDPRGFRLHLFGLQFKRWNRDGWTLSTDQLSRLRRLGHVMGYCLPTPCVIDPSNALHGFCFVNPVFVPEGSSRLRLWSPAEVLPLGSTPDEIVRDIRARLEIELRTNDFLNKSIVFEPPSNSDRIEVLRKLVRAIPELVNDVVKEFPFRSKVAAGFHWGHTALCTVDNGVVSQTVPAICWGDFLSAVKDASVNIVVPGNPEAPPNQIDPPQENATRSATGIGLTIDCSGSWGEAWARNQIESHLSIWVRTALEPPAAVIAYESFSRTMEFVEYTK